MTTFRIPLPPVSKNQAYRRTHGYGRQEALVEWERMCKLVVGDWRPPHRPLSVSITLEYPKPKLHVWDADGRLPFLLDVVVGAHVDQWVDELHVRKVAGDGWAEVSVRPLRGEADADA